MVTVIRAERRSAVLTPSNLACLSHIPTVNLTAGCSVGCIYCYAFGYSTNPGEGKVVLYANTLDKLKDELPRKRTKPPAVYFSPSSDLFQPLEEVLALGYRTLEFLLSKGIGVAFVTKGRIPDVTMSLLLNNPDMVQAQIGIISLDEDIAQVFEPNAASPVVRLEQIATLVKGGVATAARLAPILPGVTDTPEALDRLFSAIARAGVKRVAASTLFLRPAITESLKKGIQDREVLGCLLGFYRDAGRFAVRTYGSHIIALPQAAREHLLERVKSSANVHGIAPSVCACMNPDLARGTCGISGSWPRRTERPIQRPLFQMEI